MKKFKLSIFVLAILLLSVGKSFALSCNNSRGVAGSADDCYTLLTVASNETTLVSNGTVLVYDVANAQTSTVNAAFQARVSTSSATGVRVAGVSQTSVISGNTVLALVRGRGDVAVKTNDTIVSGDALFVSTSGDGSIVTSTTQTQLGFALENQTAVAGNSRSTKKAYITIV